MSLTAWRAFIEVCRSGSLSGAAAQLGYSQSAVSRQIAGLERMVGVALLERGARGVRTTPAGAAFEQHARIVVSEAERAVRSARAATAEVVPEVVLGAVPSLAAGILPSVLRSLADTTRFNWTLLPGLSDRLEEMVLGGTVDLAVVTDAPPGLPAHPRLSHTRIGSDEMCVIVPLDHSITAARIGLERFADETWVEDNTGSEALLRTAAAREGFVPRIDLRAADLMGKIAFVAAGHAVALVPGVLASALRPDVRLVRLANPPRREIFALTTASPRHRSLIDALLAELVAAV